MLCGARRSSRRDNLLGLSLHGGFTRREEVRNRLIDFNVLHLAVRRREGSFYTITVISQVRPFAMGWSPTKSVAAAAVRARRKAMTESAAAVLFFEVLRP